MAVIQIHAVICFIYSANVTLGVSSILVASYLCDVVIGQKTSWIGLSLCSYYTYLLSISHLFLCQPE
jgi:hypothetical protein